MANPNGLNPNFDSATFKKPVLSSVGATKSLTEGDSGSIIVLDRAAGITVTLPDDANPGTNYEFVVQTSVTSNGYTIKRNSTKTIIGSLIVDRYVDVATQTYSRNFFSNGAVASAVVLNGSTTGGLIGTRFIATAITSGTWFIQGILVGSGAVTTPFL